MGAVASQNTNMDAKVVLVLSGLCLSCYAAPFNPLSTANNWVASVSNVQNLPVNALLQTPVVSPIFRSAPSPIVRFAPQVVNIGTPVVKVATPVVAAPTPVVKVATPVVVSTKIVKDPTPVVKVVTPVVAAPTPVVKVATPVVAAPTPVVNVATPVVAAATPVVKSAVVASPVLVAEAPEPLDAPNPPMPSPDVPFVGGQFHAQDEMGQYAFGHHGGSNTRVETRDFLGRVTGSFAYTNPEGDVHVRKYAAASGIGFKVAGSDIPVDTPEVAAAKANLAEAFATAKAASAKAAEAASSS